MNYMRELVNINAHMLNDDNIKFNQYFEIRDALGRIVRALGHDELLFAKESSMLGRALDGEDSTVSD